MQRVFHLRYRLHPVLLPFPNMVYEEQMLQFLQDIQLGLRHDVYAAVFREKKLHMESAGTVCRLADPLGSDVLPASRTFFRGNKRLSAVRKLYGKAVCPQETAEYAMEADRGILRQTDQAPEETVAYILLEMQILKQSGKNTDTEKLGAPV